MAVEHQNLLKEEQIGTVQVRALALLVLVRDSRAQHAERALEDGEEKGSQLPLDGLLATRGRLIQ
ncbi:MAG: hypothetical protein JWN34_3252, partial [Bryobacterales bacterium]|nr:hypothetical protein [Bryobacterales bacterium]